MRTSPRIGRRLLRSRSVGLRFIERGCPLSAAPLVILCLAALLSGCGYFINPNAKIPSGPGNPIQKGSVTISPTYVALSPGQKFQFTATAAGGGTIEWLVNNVGGGVPATGQVGYRGQLHRTCSYHTN